MLSRTTQLASAILLSACFAGAQAQTPAAPSTAKTPTPQQQRMSDCNKAAEGKYESKFELTTMYNGAGTRPGEKDWNETVNAFLDKIKSDGQLAKIYDKWMKREVPAFPDSLPDIPFTVK